MCLFVATHKQTHQISPLAPIQHHRLQHAPCMFFNSDLPQFHVPFPRHKTYELIRLGFAAADGEVVASQGYDVEGLLGGLAGAHFCGGAAGLLQRGDRLPAGGRVKFVVAVFMGGTFL